MVRDFRAVLWWVSALKCRIMRKLLLTVYCCSLLSLSGRVSDESWQLDFFAARSAALKENKLMLLYFTASDWCLWCHKLDKELFGNREFQTGIERHAVRLILDFPQRPVPPWQERQNKRLKVKLAVEEFPEVILYDPREGKVLWRHGYLSTSPREYLSALEKLSAASAR